MNTIAAAALAAGATLVFTSPAFAHGAVTGGQDLVQDNAALLFLLAIVLIGAGVLAWVMLSPAPAEEEGDAPGPPETR
jgi:hypothetical protein